MSNSSNLGMPCAPKRIQILHLSDVCPNGKVVQLDADLILKNGSRTFLLKS